MSMKRFALVIGLAICIAGGWLYLGLKRSPSSIYGQTHTFMAYDQPINLCSDVSGSGTAQSCTTSPVSFSVITSSFITYTTTTANTGDLTINVNGFGAVHVRKWGGTAILETGDVQAGAQIPMAYDGTFWDIITTTQCGVRTLTDVRCYGAKGDTWYVNNVSVTGTAVTDNGSTARWKASDVGKNIAFNDAPWLAPAISTFGSTLCTGVSGGSCTGGVGGTCAAGSIDTNTTSGDRWVFIRLTASNAGRTLEGDPSLEVTIRVPLGSASNCIKFTTPTTGLTSGGTTSTNWAVYAAIDTAGVPPTIIPFAASGTEQLQSTQANCASGLPGLNVTCELDQINTATSAPPSPLVKVTTIATFTDANHIGLTSAPTNNIGPSYVAGFGTDDTTAIQNAINASSGIGNGATGGCVFFPQGEYWTNSTGIVITTSSSTNVCMRGVGNYSPRNVGGGTGNPGPAANQASAELVGFTANAILTVNPSGSVATAAPMINYLGFKDGSNACNVTAGISSPAGVTNAEWSHLAFQNLCRNVATTDGTGMWFNATAAGNSNQFHLIDHIYMRNVHNGIIYGPTGLKSTNSFHDITIYGSENGGGKCYDFTQNGGSGAGGNELIFNSWCNFFPIHIHHGDTSGNVTSLHMENTDSTTNNVIGGQKTGLAILMDGTGTANCIANTFLSSAINNVYWGIVNTSNCPNTAIDMRQMFNQGVQKFFADGSGSMTGFGPQGTLIPAHATVATLPSASVAGNGATMIVTDCTAFTVGALCTGGGSDYMIAVSNGTVWTVH